MPALNSMITTAEMNVALDQEFIANFRQDYDRLADILGIFSPETMSAGVVLNQTKITGELNDAKAADSSSGTAYVEGDLVALSKYKTEKTAIDTVKVQPYRKMTTAQAILKSGYETAVLKTDRKMLSQIRNAIVAKFFSFLANGTGEAAGKTLQAAAANVDAELGDTLESNDDSTDRIIHFVSRQDAADYLGNAAITTQTAFGLTYLEQFLGFTNVFMTNKVAKGTIWATPVENIHIFGVDFGALASGGLSYAQDSSGLIGVAHKPAYDRVSTETNVLCGTYLFPENADYIVKGTIAPVA